MATIEPISPKANSSYIPCFDGLRCLSIVLVMISHLYEFPSETWARSIPGRFGVTVFFFISGTLITRLLMAEYEKRGKIALSAFYIRRFIRLSPGLLAMVAITGAIFSLMGREVPLADACASLFYYQNYYWYFCDVTNRTAAMDIWGPTWSLAIEEHFYLMFPTLLLLIGPAKSRAISILAILCVIPVFLRIFYWQVLPSPEVYVRVATECRLDAILTGCVLAVLAHHVSMDSLKRYIGYSWQFWGCLVLLVGALLIRQPLFKDVLRNSIEQILLLVMIFQLIYTSNHQWVKQLLELPVMRYVGRISYSLYLWHLFCFDMVQSFLPVNVHLQIAAAFILSFVVGSASYFLIEMPLVKLRRRFGSHADKVEMSPGHILDGNPHPIKPQPESTELTSPKAVSENV